MVTAQFDQVNAFPSVEGKDLDSATSEGAAECDQELLMQRYRNAIAIMEDIHGELGAFEAGCGDRQGDGAAAQRYVLAIDRILLAGMLTLPRCLNSLSASRHGRIA